MAVAEDIRGMVRSTALELHNQILASLDQLEQVRTAPADSCIAAPNRIVCKDAPTPPRP